jgi:guanine deaminase
MATSYRQSHFLQARRAAHYTTHLTSGITKHRIGADVLLRSRPVIAALRFFAAQGKLISGIAPSMSAEFMRRAIALALENVRSGGGPFGAVVGKHGRIISEGANRVTATNDPTAHAEVVAIREACRTLGAFQLDGCDLYTTCEPCPMCLGAIYWARPSRVFYAGTAADAAAAGFDDAFIYDELKKAHAARRIPMTQLLREESRQIFAAWKTEENKKPY